MEEDNKIIQEWWRLASFRDPITNNPSPDVVIVFYSERVSQAIFSFIAGLG